MKQIITSSAINGCVQAPASKSVAVRALVAALLSNGVSTIRGYTPCNDAEATHHLIKKIGATVAEQNGELQIMGNPPLLPSSAILTLHCGESGLLSRIMASVALLYSSNVELVGEGSLVSRLFSTPVGFWEQMGVQQIQTDKLLHLQGQLKTPQVHIDGSGGSQVLSGLLMALPLLMGDSEVFVNNLQSKPYIDLTIDVLKVFGINIENNSYSHYAIKGNQHYQPCSFTIEGDWSGASCLLVAGAVAGSIEVTNLSTSSSQSDKAIAEVLHKVGAEVVTGLNTIKVNKKELHPFNFDATHCPDLFPALAVLAANCKGTSRIAGVQRLANKESNRALTLQSELANIGVEVYFDDNDMVIKGGSIRGGNTTAHNDHRIAMAMAVAGLTAKTPVTIDGAECVAKSYPTFFDDMKRLQQNNSL